MTTTSISREKKLGQAPQSSGYDLPLDDDKGTSFLILLTGLMTFLAVMALAGIFMTSSIAKHWSSGLENKLTIEIPSANKDGGLRSPSDIRILSQAIKDMLDKRPNIKSVHILNENDIQTLMRPWIGDIENLGELPLPGLISVTTTKLEKQDLQNIEHELHALTPDIHVDTHQKWLESILNITRGLQWAASFITIVVCLVTIVSITTAMQARMAIHSDDVELLHLMGASDNYIAGQFQRHARIISFKGSMGGMLAGVFSLILLWLISYNTKGGALPDLGLELHEILLILILPLPVCFLASLSARFTVLRALGRMP